MKRIKIRGIALLLVMLFVVSVAAGCRSEDKGKKDEPAASGEEELLEFEFFRNYAWDVGKYTFDETNKIAKWVIDNKKIKVNFTWPGGGNENEKLNIMVATNSLPEVIMVARDQTWTNLVSKDGTKDKILALDEYYNKYEGYRTNVDKEVVDFTRINGKIYGMLNWPKHGDWKGFGTGIVVNNDLYMQLGSPKLDTLDDLYNYLKLVKEKAPNMVPLQPGSGEVTFGLLWSAFGEERFASETYGIMQRPIDGKLRHVINNPRFPEFIKYLRKLYKEGLISQEYSIEMPEPVKDKLKRSRVAVYISFAGVDDADTARSILEAAGKTNPYEVYPVPAAPDVDKDSIITGDSKKVGWNVICITNNAKIKNGKENLRKAERIYEYLDWVFSNEGQRLMLCGPEGELWEGTDEKGFPIFKPGKSLKLTADEMKQLPVGQFMYPGNASFVDSLKMHLSALQSPDQREWRVNQQLKFVNKLKEATEYTGIETIEDMEISHIYVRADDYWRAKMVEFVVGNDDVDSMISVVKNELYKSYNYDKYEDYATSIWLNNRKRMGLDK